MRRKSKQRKPGSFNSGARKKRTKTPIHITVRERLGYSASQSDVEIYADWKERTSRVCKPCWELKYCPYGPFVEQSPILPALRDSVAEQNEYFKDCLKNNTVGSVSKLSDEEVQMYKEWASNEQTLLLQAAYRLRDQERHRLAGKEKSDDKKVEAWLGRGLPPNEVYRTPYDHEPHEIREEDYPPVLWKKIEKMAEQIREEHLRAIKTKQVDNRSPLEPARRAWFKKQVRSYNPEEYPESIPQVFSEASCNIFGHICPVFFTAEGLTETEEERRVGRHQLKFETMMRIVRRDDYRCQHCKKQLRDDEVEFDHKIPVAKGGSSEEHNLRLTCFGCNRDKSDSYEP